MEKRYFGVIIMIVMIASMSWKAVSEEWIQEKYLRYTLFYTESDRKHKEDYVTILNSSIQLVQNFFDDSFKKDFQVYVHPNRQSLDKQWQHDWNMPEFKSECWMVASGMATKVDMISPARWNEEACEHSYSDLIKTQQLITHELFHVYHGQLNASPDFSDVTNIDWFVEGFATYASGQLDVSRMDAVKHAIENDALPQSLDNFWTGKLKYGLSGSIVKYIDHKFGREKLRELLKYNRKDEVLNSLGVTEKDLLLAWSEFIRGHEGK